jgi:putative phosphoribosyl transferase
VAEDAALALALDQVLSAPMRAIAPARRQNSFMKPFRDREDAGGRLAAALAPWRGKNPVVYAIPRGGMPLAARIAKDLDAELDVVLTHKIGAPGNPEYAIGAVAESGWSHVQHPEFGAEYVQRETALQLEKLRERRRLYGAARVSAKGRIAIVVDDGLATGATMIAALHALREQAPAHLVCAVPVAAIDSLRRVRALADDVACLHARDDFHAVGQYYESFDQVADAQVIAALHQARDAQPPTSG